MLEVNGINNYIDESRVSEAYLNNSSYLDNYSDSSIDYYDEQAFTANRLASESADSDIDISLSRIHDIAYNDTEGNGSRVNVSYTDESGIARQKSVMLSEMSIGSYNYNRFTRTITRQLSYNKDGVNVSFTQRFQASL